MAKRVICKKSASHGDFTKNSEYKLVGEYKTPYGMRYVVRDDKDERKTFGSASFYLYFREK